MARPSQPIITTALAAKAALEIIDAEGIDGLTMERAARSLGVKAASLYHHFDNKAALLREVTRLILIDNPAAEPLPGTDWKTAITDLALATRRAIVRHPHAAPLFLQFFPRHLMLKPYERWIGLCGLDPAVSLQVLEGIEILTFGSALFGATRSMRGIAPLPAFDTAQFPQLAAALEAGAVDEEAMFIAVLQRFLSSY